MATTAPPDVPVRSLQDILTALQRHPEWRTALRQQLLGEELLELPALFGKFATETTRRLDLLTQELPATNKRLDRLVPLIFDFFKKSLVIWGHRGLERCAVRTASPSRGSRRLFSST